MTHKKIAKDLQSTKCCTCDSCLVRIGMFLYSKYFEDFYRV